MKKVFSMLAIGSMLLLSSCTSFTPIAATSNPVGNKCGTASYSTFLGIGGKSNMGINRAAKNGGITKISHIDYKHHTVLGIYNKYTLLVYGE